MDFYQIVNSFLIQLGIMNETSIFLAGYTVEIVDLGISWEREWVSLNTLFSFSSKWWAPTIPTMMLTRAEAELLKYATSKMCLQAAGVRTLVLNLEFPTLSHQCLLGYVYLTENRAWHVGRNVFIFALLQKRQIGMNGIKKNLEVSLGRI